LKNPLLFNTNSLCSHLASKNIKIKTNKAIIVPGTLYGYETLCLTLRVKLRKVFETRVLKRIQQNADYPN
jgi:hypothetical protein